MRAQAAVSWGVALAACGLSAVWGAESASGPGKEAPPQPSAERAADKARGSVSFLVDIMPLIGRLGCNAVACHGSQKGKGGLSLSMFGADPQTDYEALTKADGARRINRVEPLKSLLLLKLSGSLPHPAKWRIHPNSADYNLLAAWIAQEAPLGRENEARLVSVEVTPRERVLRKGEAVELSVTATFSDGTRKDVTGQARFTSSEASVSAVAAGGKVTAAGYGEAVLLVRYLRQASTARISVPQPLPAPFPPLEANNRIDALVYAKLKTLGIPPSGLCSDEEFLRRVYLDVTGTLPSAAEARAYLADRGPRKRSRLIDRLLGSEEFADYWAMKWCDLFRVKSEFPNTLWPNAVQAYHRWVRMSIAANKPYDQFVRELLVSTGSNFRVPPANFYRAFLKKDPQNVAEVAALTFMGVRIGCARCHGHPTENWSLDDNLGLAAFFAQLRYKSTMEWKEEIVYLNPRQTLRHPKTGQVVRPKYLGGEALAFENSLPAASGQQGTEPPGEASILREGEDARAKFAEWLTSSDNPWFARNIVNRTWFWLLGRGIVHEPDDLRPTNPPENPQLLDFLARELVGRKYDLKHIYRLILNSRTYQASSVANEWNRSDVAHFSHYYVKRLGAETLLDGIEQVTERWGTYRSIIPEPYVVMPAEFRATHLADGSISLPFLELFGRPPRDTAYESDRDLQLYLRQTLHLLNSTDVQNKINTSPRLARLTKDVADDSKIADELYLATVSRYPTDEERGKVADYVVGNIKGVPEEVVAAQKAAAEALAKARGEPARATAAFEAALKALQEAEAAVAKAKDPSAKAAATKTAAEKRKLAADAKTRRDKAPAAEKAANARLLEANKRLDAARTAARQSREQAFQDLLWALLNTKEFVFNH